MATVDIDAIVIGSGITGGWAAKELAEKGLKTLILDRGRMVSHRDDYATEGRGNFDLPYRGQWPPEAQAEQRFTHTSPVVGPANYHFFNDDRVNPYINTADKPFNWVRSDIFGGRSVVWGRQCYRWSDLDFEANKKDGHGIDWPVRYRDIAPWYSYVEKYVGISGEQLGLPQLPDGEFLPPVPMSIAEKHFKRAVAEKFDGRVVTVGRSANLTEAKPEQGRGKCPAATCSSISSPHCGKQRGKHSRRTISDSKTIGHQSPPASLSCTADGTKPRRRAQTRFDPARR